MSLGFFSVEDLKAARCLTKVGGYSVDTRDAEGKITFLIFELAYHFNQKELYPDWYKPREVDNSSKVTITFYIYFFCFGLNHIL